MSRQRATRLREFLRARREECGEIRRGQEDEWVTAWYEHELDGGNEFLDEADTTKDADV